jgi:hypothetical protein
MATFAGRYDEVLLKRDTSQANSMVRIVSGASVQVLESDGVTVADLFTDRTKGTPADNPTAPDVDGNLQFWVVPGNYVLKVSVGGDLVRTDPVSVLPDAEDSVLEAARLDAEEAARIAADTAHTDASTGVHDITGTVGVGKVLATNVAGDAPLWQTKTVFDVRDYGAVGDGVTDDSSAVQDAADAASAVAGTVYVPAGMIVHLGTTGFTASCSVATSRGASFTYSGTGIAVLVDTLDDAEIDIAVIRGTVDWNTGSDTSSIGLRIRNSNWPRVTARIRNFHTGIDMHGDNAGTSYGAIDCRDVTNNKLGIRFSKVGTGYANQHEVRGRIKMSSSYPAVAGSKLIDLTESGNGSTFISMSLEGGYEEWTVDCSVPYVAFTQCRWEQAAGVRLNATALNCVIMGGYDNFGPNAANGLQITDNGSYNTILGSRGQQFKADGGANGSGQGVILGSEIGGLVATVTNQNNNTFAELSADGTLKGYDGASGKEGAQSEPVLEWNPGTRKILFGAGTVASTMYMQALTAGIVDFSGGGVWRFTDPLQMLNANPIKFGTSGQSPQIIPGTGTPEGVVSAGVGSLFLRSDGGSSTTLYVKESGTGTTGWQQLIRAADLDAEETARIAADAAALVAADAAYVPAKVTDAGTYGDGVTDATSHLQGLLDDAFTAGGGTVFIAPGIYAISSTVTVPVGVHLAGAGQDVSKIQATGAMTAITVSSRSTIRDFWVRGDGTAGSIGVTAVADAARWQAVRVRVGVHDEGFYLNQTYIVTIQDCLVQSCTTTGLHTGAVDVNIILIIGGEYQGCPTGVKVDGGNSVTFYGVTIEGNSVYGAHVTGGTYGAKFRDCYFEANGTTHIKQTDGASVPRMITVNGCRFTGAATGHDVHFESGVDHQIWGNVSNSAAQPFQFDVDVDRLVMGPNYTSPGAEFELADYAGTNLSRFGDSIGDADGSSLTISQASGVKRPLTIKKVSGGTAYLTEWQNDAGTSIAHVDGSGRIRSTSAFESANGSAGFPAYRFTADGTTGMLLVGVGDVALTAGGVVKVRANGTGVGFNGATPVAKAANPGTAVGTDATVINAVITALRNLGLVT